MMTEERWLQTYLNNGETIKLILRDQGGALKDSSGDVVDVPWEKMNTLNDMQGWLDSEDGQALDEVSAERLGQFIQGGRQAFAEVQAQQEESAASSAGLERTVTSVVGGASPPAERPDLSLVPEEGHEGEGPGSPVSEGGVSPSSPPMQVEASLATHPGGGMGRGAVGIITLLFTAVGALAGGVIGILATGSNITGLATLGTFLGGAGLPFVLVGGAIGLVAGGYMAFKHASPRSGDASETEYTPLAGSGADSAAEMRPATKPFVSPSSRQAVAQSEQERGASQSPTPGSSSE